MRKLKECIFILEYIKRIKESKDFIMFLRCGGSFRKKSTRRLNSFIIIYIKFVNVEKKYFKYVLGNSKVLSFNEIQLK